MNSDGLPRLYQKGLLKGIVESRVTKVTGFHGSLRNVTIYLEEYRAIRRGVRWILTNAGVAHKFSDRELRNILKEIDINYKKQPK